MDVTLAFEHQDAKNVLLESTVRIATCLAAQIAKVLQNVLAMQENALVGAKKGGQEKNAIKNAMLDFMVKTVKNSAVIALKSKSVITCPETVLKDVNRGTVGLIAKKRVRKVSLVLAVAKNVDIA